MYAPRTPSPVYAHPGRTADPQILDRLRVMAESYPSTPQHLEQLHLGQHWSGYKRSMIRSNHEILKVSGAWRRPLEAANALSLSTTLAQTLYRRPS